MLSCHPVFWKSRTSTGIIYIRLVFVCSLSGLMFVLFTRPFEFHVYKSSSVKWVKFILCIKNQCQRWKIWNWNEIYDLTWTLDEEKGEWLRISDAVQVFITNFTSPTFHFSFLFFWWGSKQSFEQANHNMSRI